MKACNGLTVVVGARAADHSIGLERERAAQVGANGAIEVLLHVAQRDRRTGGDRFRERPRARHQFVVGNDFVEDAERETFVGADATAGEVQLLRAGDADELRQQPAAAVVAGQADVRERRRDERALRRNAQIARERDRHPGAGRRARQRGDRRLREVEQPQRQRLLAVLQLAHRVFERRPRSVGRCALPPPPMPGHVAAGTERAPGAGDHHAAHGGIRLDGQQHLPQRRRQFVRQRVALVGPIQRDRRNAVFDLAQQLIGTRFDVVRATPASASEVS